MLYLPVFQGVQFCFLTRNTEYVWKGDINKIDENAYFGKINFIVDLTRIIKYPSTHSLASRDAHSESQIIL